MGYGTKNEQNVDFNGHPIYFEPITRILVVV